MKFLIKNDLFNIFSRIKNYDYNYFIVFDTKLLRYQVYTQKYQKWQNAEYIGGLKLFYVLTFPFENLDARCIDHLYKTEIKNVECLIKNLNCENEKIENMNSKNLLNQAMTNVEGFLRKQSKGG